MKETRGLHLIFGVLLLVYFVPISASDKVVKVPTVLNLSAFDSSDNRNGGESANRSSRTSNLGSNQIYRGTAKIFPLGNYKMSSIIAPKIIYGYGCLHLNQ